MQNFAAIDFETANNSHSSVCSVGIVIVKNGRTCKKFYRLIKPMPDHYLYWNTRVHGLTEVDTREAACFPDVWAEIAPFLKDLPLVAHNSAFDESCLRAVFQAYEMPYPNYRFYCTYKASKRLLKDKVENHQLHTVAAHCGYELTNHHHALADAEACAAIAKQLLEDEATKDGADATGRVPTGQKPGSSKKR